MLYIYIKKKQGKPLFYVNIFDYPYIHIYLPISFKLANEKKKKHFYPWNVILFLINIHQILDFCLLFFLQSMGTSLRDNVYVHIK